MKRGEFNSRKETWLVILWLSGLLIATPFPATALLPVLTQSVTLVWGPSPSPDVVGYNIYYGVTSGVYTDEISAGNMTNLTIPGLLEGTTYYFAAQSVNSAGLQSVLSTQLSLTISPAAILGSPVFSTNGLSFAVTGVPGSNYVVQVSTNLINWTPLATNAAPFQFTDPNAKYFKSRFYRVVYP